MGSRRLDRQGRAFAALALALAAASATAGQDAPRLPMVGGDANDVRGSCAAQTWPREALRYEIEGVTGLYFHLSPEGRVMDPVVGRSSGWALLDDASIKALRTCTFKQEDVAKAQGRQLPMQFVWMLDSKPTYPSLVPGSCTGSGPITGFRAFDPRPTDAGGVKVRFLIDGNGQPGAVKLEGAVDAALAGQVVRYLESCRFGFGPGDTATRTDTMNGRVLLR